MAPSTGIIGDQSPNAFDVVPVLDLKDGTVVHARAGKQARAGKRAEYRPIATPFAPPHDAQAIARALLGITFSPTLYIADLDAILGRGNNYELCQALADVLPGVDLWIDAGFCNLDDCAFWLPLGATLVIGSETVQSLEDWKTIRDNFGANLVLSLDFDEQGLRGPKELMSDLDLWPGGDRNRPRLRPAANRSHERSRPPCVCRGRSGVLRRHQSGRGCWCARRARRHGPALWRGGTK